MKKIRQILEYTFIVTRNSTKYALNNCNIRILTTCIIPVLYGIHDYNIHKINSQTATNKPSCNIIIIVSSSPKALMCSNCLSVCYQLSTLDKSGIVHILVTTSTNASIKFLRETIIIFDKQKTAIFIIVA